MNVLLCTTVFLGSLFHRMAEPARAVQEADLGIDVTVQRGLKTTMYRNPWVTAIGRGAARPA